MPSSRRTPKIVNETYAELLYAESVRRLSQQMAVLAGLRTRAIELFSAAAVATSVLGGLSARDADGGAGTLKLGVYGWCAVSLFIAAMAASLVMFWNMPALRFSVPRETDEDSGIEGVEQLLGAPPALANRTEAFVDLTQRLETLYELNYRTMKWLFRLMTALPIIVGAELLFWGARFVWG